MKIDSLTLEQKTLQTKGCTDELRGYVGAAYENADII